MRHPARQEALGARHATRAGQRRRCRIRPGGRLRLRCVHAPTRPTPWGGVTSIVAQTLFASVISQRRKEGSQGC